MRGNRKRDTRPEVALRSVLHRAGARFRCDFPIRLEGRRLTRVDIAFPRAKVAVFVDGCFWHRCPEHGSTPNANRTYWEPKLLRNVERDGEVDCALVGAGWLPLHVWEHQDPTEAARKVQSVVNKRR
jgi:DNA mismatch endonuclease (patch repair protein)